MKVTLQKVIDFPLAQQMEILTWRNSPEISQYFLIPYIDEGTHRQWLAAQAVQNPKTQAFFICVDNELIGCAYFSRIDHQNKTVEPGMFMDPKIKKDYFGIGTVAGYLQANYAFDKLKMEKMNIEVLANNLKTLRSNRRFGYVDEGCIRGGILKNNKRYDIYLLGMFADEWNERKNEIYKLVKDYL